MDVKLSELTPKEIIPGYLGKLIHTENMTIAFWEVKKGAVVPEHDHMHEQIMQVLEGKFEFTVDGETKIYEADDIVVIPGHVSHSGRAITYCRIMDVFSPVREEYK
ncbi:MAG: cupin domain-containing protein [Eudoraea sp.]|nr:cupin domain-containing protein [Eudoraea sp.]